MMVQGFLKSVVRASTILNSAARLMEYHLLREAENNMRTWFARVPTEANIADYPSRNMPHDLLEQRLDESAAASIWFESLVNILELGPARQMGECRQPGPT
jgi:hypothetical protein